MKWRTAWTIEALAFDIERTDYQELVTIELMNFNNNHRCNDDDGEEHATPTNQARDLRNVFYIG